MPFILDYIIRPIFLILTSIGFFILIRDSLYPFIRRKIRKFRNEEDTDDFFGVVEDENRGGVRRRRKMTVEEELAEAERILEMADEEESLRKKQQQDFEEVSSKFKKDKEGKKKILLEEKAKDLKVIRDFGRGYHLQTETQTDIQRDEQRELRRQQDQDYQNALRVEQQRENEKRNKKKKSEEEILLQKKQEEEERELLLKSVPLEPTQEEIEKEKQLRDKFNDKLESYDKKITKVSVRFPDGSRLTRYFRMENTLNDLMNYLKASKGIPEVSSVRILSNFPQKLNLSPYEPEQLKLTFNQAKLYPEVYLIAVKIN